jgi:GNAT superfamily N-acetyltransferase
MEAELERRLVRHLEHRLGQWPPQGTLEIVASPLRTEPDWDKVVRPVLGVATPSGAVISVPPEQQSKVAALAVGGWDALSAGIGAIFGQEGVQLGGGVFRYLQTLVDVEPLGEWVEPDDDRLPGWLRPFNGGILIVCDDHDQYMAGVGLKLHDEFASEVAVGTEPAFRGRGFARRLVATAAARVAASGATLTYEHVADNFSSSAVAAASGFPDIGWRAVHLGEEE